MKDKGIKQYFSYYTIKEKIQEEKIKTRKVLSF